MHQNNAFQNKKIISHFQVFMLEIIYGYRKKHDFKEELLSVPQSLKLTQDYPELFTLFDFLY